MDSSAFSTWNLIIQIAFLVSAIVISTLIRKKVKIIRNSLLPSSVIAGVIIFILKFIPPIGDFINNEFMEIITYHCLALGFICLALKTSKKNKDNNKFIILDTGLTQVNTYLIQAIIGLGLSLVLSITIFPNLFYGAGLLLPMGFGQGTGQALNVGGILQNYGFEDGRTFGLAIAAIGFMVACLCGVIYLNYLRKKGRLKLQEQRIAENKLDTNIYEQDEAPLNESVDKMTMQIGLVLLVYLVVYLVILGLSTLAETYLGDFGKNTIKPLLWGFNFLFGTLFAMLAKKILSTSKKKKLLNHNHINNYFMNRLSGFFFDLMIVAGIAAIDWKNLKGLLFSLLIICTLGGIGTFFYLKFIAKKLYPNYQYEGFFSLFGMLTGTASTGLILLREIDPNFETPASENMVLSGVPAMVFGAPILLLMSFAGENITNSLITLGIICGMFVIYNIFVLRRFIFKKKKKKKIDEEKGV